MTEQLRFDLMSDSSSLSRARDTPVHVAQIRNGDPWIVCFEDSDDVHEVQLHRDTDGWQGTCWQLDDKGRHTGQCRGWAYHDGPCAHLWAVRSHLAHQRLEDPDERHSTDVERIMADGGYRHTNTEGRR